MTQFEKYSLKKYSCTLLFTAPLRNVIPQSRRGPKSYTLISNNFVQRGPNGLSLELSHIPWCWSAAIEWDKSISVLRGIGFKLNVHFTDMNSLNMGQMTPDNKYIPVSTSYGLKNGQVGLADAIRKLFWRCWGNDNRTIWTGQRWLCSWD